VLRSLRLVTRATVQLAEPEVGVGDRGVHPELGGECQRLAVVAFGLGAAGRRNVTGEAEGVGLAGPGPQAAGERECLTAVAGGLGDPSGCQVGPSRAEKNVRRPEVRLTNTNLLDGARSQRERFVRPAREAVRGAERRGYERYPEADLQRSAEVETPLEDLGRAWEVPATKVSQAELE
jgi:hypothetical protein